MNDNTERYGLLGERLTHSFSPAIHAKLGTYEYRLFERRPEQLEAFLSKESFRGINVTMPYKKAVIPYCQELTQQARRIGSVNTMLRRADGTLLGHNTDYDGFGYLVAQAGICVAGKKALVLGTGGASLTVHAVLQDLGVGELVSVSRSGTENYDTVYRHTDAQIIVNTTPVGMYPNTGVSPIQLECFAKLEGIFDLIYNPAKTKLLLDAQRLGIPNANGLGMLVAQAKAATELFFNQEIPSQRVAEITREIERSTCNILLVGMPGCGKTTVGTALAKKLARKLVDIDEMIEQQVGCTIPQLFAQRGEAAFRALEHQVLGQVSKQSGQVIATGGGIVTREENFDLLLENSMVVFLRRDLSLLPVVGRPISQAVNLEQLYQTRLPLYQRAAQITMDNITVDEAVIDIIRRLEL